MVASSSSWDEEVVDRWTKVGEMGMEAARREIGCSEGRISRGLRKDKNSYFRSSDFIRKSNVFEAASPTSSMANRAHSGDKGHLELDDTELDFYTELEISTILATVGRDISCEKTVCLGDEMGTRWRTKSTRFV